jgi:hypothetical protein
MSAAVNWVGLRMAWGVGGNACLPLLDSTVRLDINDIADPVKLPLATVVFCLSVEARRFVIASNVLELPEVGRHADHTLLAEVAREGIASASTETCGVTHLA